MMNLSTTSTDYDEDKLCSNTTKWLCDSPQEIKNKSLKLKPTKNSIGSNDSWNQNEWESYPKPLKRSDKNQVYEWRKKAFESILSSSDHDDEHEKINPSNNQNRPGHKVIIDSLNPEQTTMGWEAMINNSAKVKLNSFKIMAPNVGKLSLSSCVEVHIKQNDSESHDETIKVLCSVDVLKMRSSVFQDILVLEEKNRNVASQIPVHSPWRSPIKIQQDHPHDAASFVSIRILIYLKYTRIILAN